MTVLKVLNVKVIMNLAVFALSNIFQHRHLLLFRFSFQLHSTAKGPTSASRFLNNAKGFKIQPPIIKCKISGNVKGFKKYIEKSSNTLFYSWFHKCRACAVIINFNSVNCKYFFNSILLIASISII